MFPAAVHQRQGQTTPNCTGVLTESCSRWLSPLTGLAEPLEDLPPCGLAQQQTEQNAAQVLRQQQRPAVSAQQPLHHPGCGTAEHTAEPRLHRLRSA